MRSPRTSCSANILPICSLLSEPRGLYQFGNPVQRAQHHIRRHLDILRLKNALLDALLNALLVRLLVLVAHGDNLLAFARGQGVVFAQHDDAIHRRCTAHDAHILLDHRLQLRVGRVGTRHNRRLRFQQHRHRALVELVE